MESADLRSDLAPGCRTGPTGVTGMEALARAKGRREAAQAAQAARMTAEKAAIAKAHEDAKEHGLAFLPV